MVSFGKKLGFCLKFGVKDQSENRRKEFCCKISGFYMAFTRFDLLFCPRKNFFSLLGAQAVIWGAQPRNASSLDLSKKRGVLKCEKVRTFSRCITSKTITYQFLVGFINVHRSRKAIFYFQDLRTNFYQPLDSATGNKRSN